LKIKIISRKGEKIRFLLEGTTPAFANSMRRIMISEIPNLSVDSVGFEDNTSALFDEIIAHRLAMLPLVFDPDKFNPTSECKCEGKGCPSCQVFFALEKNGPATVYSSDLKSSNKSVKVTSPDFPIVKLLKNQRLKLEAIAKLGIGREHPKYQTANAAYSFLPSLEFSKHDDLKKIVNSCPKSVLEVKANKLVMIDPYECDECKACEEASGGDVKIGSDQTRFVFSVESICGLEPAYIIEKAAQVLQEKAKDFRDQLKDV
jgi:DNA-directed RNA polymerase subunit D